MIPLLGDVRLQREDPYEMSRRKYLSLRKLLAEKVRDLEIPFEEVEILPVLQHHYDVLTGRERNTVYNTSGGIGKPATDFYKDAFARNGFMPMNPEYPKSIGYIVLE